MLRSMNGLRIFGIVLIIAGGLALAYNGFSYKKKDKLLEIGGQSISITTSRRVNVPTWAGFVMLGAGVVFLVAGKRSK